MSEPVLDSRCSGHTIPSSLLSFLPFLSFYFIIFFYLSSIALSIHLATRPQFSSLCLSAPVIQVKLTYPMSGFVQTVQAWPIREMHFHDHSDARKWASNPSWLNKSHRESALKLFLRLSRKTCYFSRMIAKELGWKSGAAGDHPCHHMQTIILDIKPRQRRVCSRERFLMLLSAWIEPHLSQHNSENLKRHKLMDFVSQYIFVPLLNLI